MMTIQTASVISKFLPSTHDHSRCIEVALNRATVVCDLQGLRLTPIRRRVLELIWHSHAPIGAYSILKQLAQNGRKAMPPTVYRAIAFLRSASLVHRLDSLNAYVGCGDPSEAHSGQFFICRKCDSVAEIHDAAMAGLLADQAATLGFHAENPHIEVSGLCSRCEKSNR
jgi:Fur family zinc uptake transcriptional regulator